MSDWKKDMADILAAGLQPTIDDLEAALAGALTERNALARELAGEQAKNRACVHTIEDMAGWLGKLASAFIKGDADKLAETLSEFVKQRVKPVMPKGGPVH